MRFLGNSNGRSRFLQVPQGLALALQIGFLRMTGVFQLPDVFTGDHSSAGGRAHGFASVGCQGREDQFPLGVG